jgi:WD40 repeat protein
VKTGTLFATEHLPQETVAFGLTPDDSAVVATITGSVRVVDLKTHKLRFEVTKTVGDALGAWTPDGSKVAFSRAWNDGFTKAVVLDGKTGASLDEIQSGSFLSTWSPDGQNIVRSDRKAGVTCVWNTSSKACGATLSLSDAEPTSRRIPDLAWSPGGAWLSRRIERIDQKDMVELYDAKTGALHRSIDLDPNGAVFQWVDDEHFAIAMNDLLIYRVSDDRTIVLSSTHDNRNLVVFGPGYDFDGTDAALADMMFRGDDIVASPLVPYKPGMDVRSAGLLAKFLQKK